MRSILGKMMIDFENILHDLQKWENGKGVLIYGANDIFCSGGDLNFARKANTPQAGYEMSVFMQRVLNEFSRLSLVSVAYINGLGKFYIFFLFFRNRCKKLVNLYRLVFSMIKFE